MGDSDYLLPDTHWPHGTCQSPKPSHDLRSGPPVLTVMTTSPFFTLSKNHLALSGARLMTDVAVARLGD
jgi:hypothetical protein